MACSEATGLSQFSSHPSDTTSWLKDPGITPSIREKFLLLGYYTNWMGIILMQTPISILAA